ncbi:MAG: hypothetical protein NTX50_07905 [Candidatus Sumerlaeota bacterium]|nr:hypothetical protein [Candidatus Sumerlaeota bacterium]
MVRQKISNNAGLAAGPLASAACAFAASTPSGLGACAFYGSWHLLAAMIFALAVLSANAAPPGDLVSRAAQKPAETREWLLSLPTTERTAALQTLLASSNGRARQVAVRTANDAFDTKVLDLVRKAAETETKPGPAEEYKKIAAFLEAYKNIQLDDAELSQLLPGIKNPAVLSSAPAGGARQSAPARLDIMVMNARGEPVTGARIAAYCMEYGLRAPLAEEWAGADRSGKANLDLSSGLWTVVAYSPSAYAKSHEGRGVFMVKRDLKVEQPIEQLTLRPTSELALSFEDAGEAESVFLMDRRLGAELSFSSLGPTKNRRITVESNGDPWLALLAAGHKSPEEAWMVSREMLVSSGSISIRPMDRQQSTIRFAPPRLLPEIKSARVSVYYRSSGPLRCDFETRPGATLTMTPGTVEMDYTINTGQSRFIYGPAPHELSAGQSFNFILDSPSTAVMFQEHRKSFELKKNVLLACLAASDANGHFLTALQNASGKPAPFTMRVFCGEETVADFKSDLGRFSNEIASDLSPDKAAKLTYQIDCDLGPGIPKRINAAALSQSETAHFHLEGPAPVAARMEALGRGTEIVYEKIRALVGQAPRWDRLNVSFHPVLPPTVGGSYGGGRINLAMMLLARTRWIADNPMGVFSHELLHAFDFGHDDLMAIWVYAVRKESVHGQNPAPFLAIPGATAKAVLAVLRGEKPSAPGAAPWIIYLRNGIQPLRAYQDVEKQIKPRMQAASLNDDETLCAILSDAAGEDFADLYQSSGSPIRQEFYAKGRAILTAWKDERSKTVADGRASSASAAATVSDALSTSAIITMKSPTESLKRLNAAIGRANTGNRRALEGLRQYRTAVNDLALNRERVVTNMRIGEAFYHLDEKPEAFEAFRQAQREAIKVDTGYLNTCRRISTDFLLGNPLRLSHM